ncbi:hypothetical protein MLD38_030300 [Melastoma candidum]|uniref:Uncharacterized protein n=1 Tax=Melastoma candidum TaxID=119954 RepID=A0ACB9MLB9_9MYRT|nr:hypothetical protein MLD38_030300 [Melastoma candidum]
MKKNIVTTCKPDMLIVSATCKSEMLNVFEVKNNSSPTIEHSNEERVSTPSHSDCTGGQRLLQLSYLNPRPKNGLRKLLLMVFDGIAVEQQSDDRNSLK